MEDQAAYQVCREAVLEVAGGNPPNDGEWFTLAELDNLVVLQNALLESLRLYQALFATREAVEDFILNPKEKPRIPDTWWKRGQ